MYSYEIAVQQGVDLRRAPCIWVGGGRNTWVVVVDVTGRRAFREVASECPEFDSGRVKHAVVLNRNGSVLEAK